MPVAASNTRAPPTAESPLPVATRVPSGLNATAFTVPSWSSRASSAPVAASNTRALRSLPQRIAAAGGYPGAVRAERHRVHLAVVVQAGDSAPVAASNTRAPRSLLLNGSPLPVATRVPSGLNATAFTGSSWSRRESSVPVAASNTWALPPLTGSPLPVATRVPSGLNATAFTAPSWSSRETRRRWPRRIPALPPSPSRCRWLPGCRPG